jgi:phage portal protein BeeE
VSVRATVIFGLSPSAGQNGSDRMSARMTVILEQGLEYRALDLSVVDARFIESREFALSDVARAFDPPPSGLVIKGVLDGTGA